MAWSDEAGALGGINIPYPGTVSRTGSSVGPGLEIWALRTPLDVWADAQPAAAGGTECILAAALPGAFARMTVMWDGGAYSMQPEAPIVTPEVPSNGIPFAVPKGCPAPRAPSTGVLTPPSRLWQALVQDWGRSAASEPLATGNVVPHVWQQQTLQTGQWQRAQLWVARVPVPAAPPRSGAVTTAVAAVRPSGLVQRGGPIAVTIRCPTGEQPNTGHTACVAPTYGAAWFVSPVRVGGHVTLDALVPPWVSEVTAQPASNAALAVTLTRVGGGAFVGLGNDGMPPGGTSVAYTAQQQLPCGGAVAPSVSLFSVLSSVNLCGLTPGYGMPYSYIVTLAAYTSNGGWGAPTAQDWAGHPYSLWAASVAAPDRAGPELWDVMVPGVGTLGPTMYVDCPPGKVVGRGGQCVAPPKKHHSHHLPHCPPPVPGVGEGAPPTCCPEGMWGMYPNCYWPGTLPPNHAYGVTICGTLGPKCQSWMLPGHGSYECLQGMRWCLYGPKGKYPPPNPVTLELDRYMGEHPGCLIPAISNGEMDGHPPNKVFCLVRQGSG